VRRLESRRVEFGYAVDHADDGRLLATATVALLALDASMALRRLPDEVKRMLSVTPDPVRLGFTTAGIHHRTTEDTE
jgi:acyl-CoA thioesterase FadM